MQKVLALVALHLFHYLVFCSIIFLRARISTIFINFAHTYFAGSYICSIVRDLWILHVNIFNSDIVIILHNIKDIN